VLLERLPEVMPTVFAGSLGTQVVKVFELAIAGTGLHDGMSVGALSLYNTNAAFGRGHADGFIHSSTSSRSRPSPTPPSPGSPTWSGTA
jgi:hypothetical protein